MSIRSVSLIFFVASNVVSVMGQARALTEQEIVTRYVKESTKLASIRSQVLAADKLLDRARSALFPTLDINATAGETKPSATVTPALGGQTTRNYQGTLNATQPLYEGGVLANGLKQAKLNVNKVEQDYLAAKQQSLQDLLTAAYSLGSAGEYLAVLQESQKFQFNYLTITRGKTARGNARAYELTQAEADYAAYTPRLRVQERIVVNTQAQLRVQLDLSEDEVGAEGVQFKLPDPSPYGIPSLEEALKVAVENRPDIRSLTIAKEQAQVQKWIDLSSDLPSLNLIGYTGYQSPTQKDFNSGSSEIYGVALNLKIPLFSGLSSMHKYRAAEYNITAVERNLEDLRRQVKVEVSQGFEALKAAKEVLQSTAEWSKKARTALEQALQSYRVGTITSVQIIQIQTARERAALSYIDALNEYHASLLRMRKAMGIDLEKVYGEKGS